MTSAFEVPPVKAPQVLLQGASAAERLNALYKLSELFVANQQFTQHQHHVLTGMIRERHKALVTAIDTYAAADQIEQLRNALAAAIIGRLEAVWGELFVPVPTTEAKKISKTDKANLGVSKPSLVYGEVSFPSLAAVLWGPHIKLKPGGVFVDLGSGTGRGVFGAALLHNFDRCVGIEILHGLHVAAQRIHERWNKEYAQFVTYPPAGGGKLTAAAAAAAASSASAGERKGGGPGAPSITLLRASFLDVDWSDADVVFVNSTCFDETLLADIARLALALKDGTYVITLTKRLKLPHFRLLDSTQYSMSWGYATVHIQQKITPDAQLPSALVAGITTAAAANTTAASTTAAATAAAATSASASASAAASPAVAAAQPIAAAAPAGAGGEAAAAAAATNAALSRRITG